MSVREYIGARYVPLFADPIEWDNTKTYEPLTIVYYQGNSYTSRQAVPTGIAITNTDYWALTGNYNAQIEAYRAEVQEFADDISALEGALPTGVFDSTHTVDDRFDVIEANNWVSTARIADDAVTDDKLAANAVDTQNIKDNAITSAKIADRGIKAEDIEQDIFLIFGDSWCNFNSWENWGAPVAKVMNCEMINYGVSGASFCGQDTIASQITLAISELTAAQKNRVKYVMIMAGVNDFTPNEPSNFMIEVNAAILNCVNNFENAVVQWFPTSCTKAYGGDGTKHGKLYAWFWHFVATYGSGSNTTTKGKRVCFPKCGPAFWFNSNTTEPSFFKSDGIHVNEYGKNALVQAVLDGYGLLNIEWSVMFSFQAASRWVNVNVKPTAIEIFGEVGANNQTSYSFNEWISDRIRAAAHYLNSYSVTTELTMHWPFKTTINNACTDTGYVYIAPRFTSNADIYFNKSYSDVHYF